MFICCSNTSKRRNVQKKKSIKLESVLYVLLDIRFLQFWKEPCCCLSWIEFGNVTESSVQNG